MQKIIDHAVKAVGLSGPDQQLGFPLITKSGINQEGKRVHYYFNYSNTMQTFTYPYAAGVELISQEQVKNMAGIQLKAWDLKIIEEK